MDKIKYVLALPLALVVWLVMGVHTFLGWVTGGRWR
jgi:hypothetical protein